MARRKGNEWFVGALTNNEGSAQSVNLSFLDKERPIWPVFIRMGEIR